VGCPPPETVRKVLDKDVTLAIARDLGIPLPTTCLLNNLAELHGIRPKLKFPLVVKDRTKTSIHRSTFKVRYLRDLEQVEAAFRQEPALGSRVIFQEYARGADIGFGLLLHRGEIVAEFQYLSLKDLPVSGGVTVFAVSERTDPLIRRMSHELLRALGWEGIAMVEFRRDPTDGQLTLLEVNGRYWGSSSLAIMAGVDLPLYAWQIAHGIRPEVPSSYRTDLTWRWTAGYLRRLHNLRSDPVPNNSCAASLMAELADLPRAFHPCVASALELRQDPLPGLLEIARTIGDLIIIDSRRLLATILPRWVRRRLGRREAAIHPNSEQPTPPDFTSSRTQCLEDAPAH
jgi:predicted ATP-grasp superfamily ATP-dependent carboligase